MQAALIIELIRLAIPIILQIEQLILGARKGDVKKDAVVTVLQGAADIAAKSGANSAEVNLAKGLVPDVVDLAVTTLNNIGLLRPHAEEAQVG